MEALSVHELLGILNPHAGVDTFLEGGVLVNNPWLGALSRPPSFANLCFFYLQDGGNPAHLRDD